MLKSKWIWILSVTLSWRLYSQQFSSGIYLNYSDFISHELSIALSDSNISYIHSHRILALPYISVKQGGQKHQWLKDSIFAYQDSNGQVIRFIQGSEYLLLNTDTVLLIYKQIRLTGFKREQEIHYFFSINPHHILYPLTFSALKKCFKSDESWLTLLDLYFKTESDLMHYDSFSQQYTLIKQYKQYLSTHVSTK